MRNLISVDYDYLFPNGNLQERRLVITDPTTNKDYLEGIPLYIDGEISLKFSSRYDSIYQSEPSTLLNLLSASLDFPISGQFAVQGAQIWKSTDPLDISIEAKLMMMNDGKKDVVEPALKLSELTLPSLTDRFEKFKELSNIQLKCLIPPGPNIQSILSEMKTDGYIKGSHGTYDIQIGWLKLHNCIIKESSPTFSKTVDENGYPVSAEISLSITTLTVPTKESLDSMLTEIESQSNSAIEYLTSKADSLSNSFEDKLKNILEEDSSAYINV